MLVEGCCGRCKTTARWAFYRRSVRRPLRHDRMELDSTTTAPQPSSTRYYGSMLLRLRLLHPPHGLHRGHLRHLLCAWHGRGRGATLQRPIRRCVSRRYLRRHHGRRSGNAGTRHHCRRCRCRGGVGGGGTMLTSRRVGRRGEPAHRLPCLVVRRGDVARGRPRASASAAPAQLRVRRSWHQRLGARRHWP